MPRHHRHDWPRLYGRPRKSNGGRHICHIPSWLGVRREYGDREARHLKSWQFFVGVYDTALFTVWGRLELLLELSLGATKVNIVLCCGHRQCLTLHFPLTPLALRNTSYFGILQTMTPSPRTYFSHNSNGVVGLGPQSLVYTWSTRIFMVRHQLF